MYAPTFINLLILAVILGFIAWAVNMLNFIDATWKKIIQGACAVIFFIALIRVLLALV